MNDFPARQSLCESIVEQSSIAIIVGDREGMIRLWNTGAETMFGWTAGGGVEWAYAAKWTAKVEYAYFDFGNLDTTGSSNFAEHERQSIDVTAQTVKIGVNYRWGAP